MSSATKFVPNAFRSMVAPTVANAMRRVENLGMSPRQQEMNRRWAYYCCAQYDARETDWDGTHRPSHIEREVIASQGFVPPGFYDASGAAKELPLKYRRPTIAYHLVKVAVDRFTGLLFSERQHPHLAVDADDKTNDYVQALVEEARVWPAMIQARRYGGATGTAVFGFRFLNGRPVVDIHDPRWCKPVWKSRSTFELAALEKRYVYPAEVKNEETGNWEEVPTWYRRVIDEERDVVYKPVPVGDGEEPTWTEDEVVAHNFGFCPVVWVQNLPVEDDVDGETDCHGGMDIVESVDSLLSQGFKGIVANCDPTVVVASGLAFSELRKGSENAIKVGAGENASYMEANMAGPAAAREMVTELRAYFLEVVQCVLDHPDAAAQTATEVERRYSSMLGKADIMREQYGQRGVLPLVEMMLRAARALGRGRPNAEGLNERQYLVLPPRKDEETGKLVQRELGDVEGARVTIHWPGYFQPGLADATQAAQAVGSARLAGILDTENAVKFAAPYFRVEDVDAVVAKLAEEASQRREDIQSDLLGESAGPDAVVAPAGEELPEAAGASGAQAVPVAAGAVTADMPEDTLVAAAAPAGPGGVPLGTKFFQYEIEGGIVTLNEVRASKGLPPMVDGDLTLPAYRAKYAELYSKNAAAQKPELGEEALGVEKPEPPSFSPPGLPGGGGGPTPGAAQLTEKKPTAGEEKPTASVAEKVPPKSE